MKLLRMTLLIGLVGLLVSAQTLEIGQKVYFNDEGYINIAVDAAYAIQNLERDYVMFVLYMGVDPDIEAIVHRDDVILIHNGQEYQMPEIKDFRANYKRDRRDMDLYNRMGKDSLVLSSMRYYQFQWKYDFFPARGQNVRITDEGAMSSNMGFKTKAYFKNPGFKTGDQIIIKVKDKKNPEVWGACAAEL